MKLALILLGLAIAIMTFAAYKRWGEFWFARGSDSTLSICRLSLWVTGTLGAAVLLDIAILVVRPGPRPLALAVLPVLVAVWALSGRALGVHADGRIIAGWFFLQTRIIDLRDADEDYEAHVAHTQVRVSPVATLEFAAHGGKARLFVGPFLLGPAVRMLKAHAFEVSDDAMKAE